MTSVDTAAFREVVSAATQNSWGELANALANSLITVFGAKAGRRLYTIGVMPIDGQQTSFSMVSTQSYNAADLYISVKGESSIQVQNRTLADGSGDNADMSNIFNNPLRGKYYSFRSGRPCIRNVGGAVAQNTFFFDHDTISGAIRTQDRYGNPPGNSDFSDVNAASLRKPPNGNFFTNCTNTRYTTVVPGGILRSKIEATVSKSLTNWMYLFSSKFITLFPLPGGETALQQMGQPDPADWRLGVSHCYGLEKMVDTQVVTSPELQVGHEHNLFMVGGGRGRV